VVPLLGDLFDAAWKANLRNIALLEREVAAGRPLATSWLMIGGVAALLLTLLVGAGVLCVAVLSRILALL
jgi:hypothetical protein